MRHCRLPQRAHDTARHHHVRQAVLHELRRAHRTVSGRQIMTNNG